MKKPPHAPGTLLIRTRTGRIYQGKGLHIFVCQAHGIKPTEVVACGVVVKGPREIWEKRQPT